MDKAHHYGELFDRYMRKLQALELLGFCESQIQNREVIIEHALVLDDVSPDNIPFLPVFPAFMVPLSRQMRGVKVGRMLGQVSARAGAFCYSFDFQQPYFIFNVALGGDFQGIECVLGLEAFRDGSRLPLRQVEIIALAVHHNIISEMQIAALDSRVMPNTVPDEDKMGRKSRRDNTKYAAIICNNSDGPVLTSVDPEQRGYALPSCADRRAF